MIQELSFFRNYLFVRSIIRLLLIHTAYPICYRILLKIKLKQVEANLILRIDSKHIKE